MLQPRLLFMVFIILCGAATSSCRVCYARRYDTVSPMPPFMIPLNVWDGRGRMKQIVGAGMSNYMAIGRIKILQPRLFFMVFDVFVDISTGSLFGSPQIVVMQLRCVNYIQMTGICYRGD